MIESTAPHKLTCSSHCTSRAFTLVELLVVISIITLLIALLLPAMSQARFRTRTIQCGSNEHQIYVATAAYATDNHDYLPGINIVVTTKGADYVNGFGCYPWEPTAADNSSGNRYNVNGNTGLPPRWYGTGVLVGLQYLVPTRIVECTDFTTVSPGVGNFSYNGEFTLTSAYAQANGDPNQTWINAGGNQGSYVINSEPYYNPDTTNLSMGKIGVPGRNGGYWLPGDLAPHITALIMCLTSDGTLGGDIYPTITHERLGVNAAYIDGHVKWLLLTNEIWSNFDTVGAASSGDDVRAGYTFWPWASLQF